MTAGRKTTHVSPAEKPAIEGELIEASIAATTQLAELTQAVSIDQMRLSEWIGVRKGLSLVQKLVTVTDLKMLAEIKESKQYKGLQVFDRDGKPVTVTTWEQFCETQELSREHVDEGLRNLSEFGDKFLSLATEMGVGYRELRKLRKLPEQDRELIINGEAVQTGDRESLIDLIEEQAVLHHKKVESLEKDLAETRATAEARSRVLADKEATITRLQEELAGRPGVSVEFLAQERLDSIEAEVRSIAGSIMTTLRSQFIQLGAPELGVGDVIRKQVIGAAIGRIIAVTRQQAADFDIAVSGPESVDAESPWDDIWAMTLRDFDAAQAKGATPDDGDVIEA